jgi:hypothetical protein
MLAERPYELGYTRTSGKMILKWFLKKYGVRIWIRFIWLRYEPVTGFCEYVMKFGGSTKASVLTHRE